MAKALGNRRVTGKEQFYTPPAVADETVQLLLKARPDALDKKWLEPAGGTGAFLDAFERAGVSEYWSCDIEPLDSRVEVSNFLETFLSPSWITVSNPPFGRNNSLSVKFFNHAAEISDVIAFIVPRSWRKWSVINRLNRNFHLISDQNLSIDYIDYEGNRLKGGKLRTCVQVWEKRDQLRDLFVVEDRGYIKKVKFDQANVSLTVFGYGCGNVKTDFPTLPNTTQMFLEVSSPTVLEALQVVDYSQFFNNVAYTEALSIKEINFLLNEHFDNE